MNLPHFIAWTDILFCDLAAILALKSLIILSFALKTLIDDDNTRIFHVFEMLIEMNEFDHRILALLQGELRDKNALFLKKWPISVVSIFEGHFNWLSVWA